MNNIPSIQENLTELEKTLQSTFLPIKPSQNFVGDLHTRLKKSTVFQKQEQIAYALLATAGGLITGLIVFLIGKLILNEQIKT